MKKALNILLSTLLIAAPALAQYETSTIRNFFRVNETFCTGGQPRLEHLESLKAEGVKAIINLRTPEEHRAAEEEAKAKEMGLRYFNIPVIYSNPKEEQVTEFLKLTDDPENRPAFIHCTAAIRVGAFWMIRRVLRDNWTVEDAKAEARKVGLVNAPHLEDFVMAYIAKYGKPKQATNPRPQSAPAPQAVPVLEGLDPVLLAKGKEAQGEMNISVTRGQYQYLFANAENKAEFEKNPQRYEIQLGGSCARMGPPVTGNPDLFAVYNERIYIFGSEDCKKRFQATPEKYLDTEETSKPASPEAIKKGLALIEKAVEAMGGAARLDKITSYQENRVLAQQRRTGDVEVKQTDTVVFPNQLRQDFVAPDYQQATVITPAESFGYNPAAMTRGTRPLPDTMRAEIEKQILRNPVLILKHRKSAGFKAAAAGSDKAGQTTVEMVAVEMSNLKLTLGIDPATGRVLSLSYRGRGRDGTIGNVTKIYSDFRNVDGLTLAFKTEGAFNGVAAPEHSSKAETIIVNGHIAPSLFEKPKTASAQ